MSCPVSSARTSHNPCKMRQGAAFAVDLVCPFGSARQILDDAVLQQPAPTRSCPLGQSIMNTSGKAFIDQISRHFSNHYGRLLVVASWRVAWLATWATLYT